MRKNWWAGESACPPWDRRFRLSAQRSQPAVIFQNTAVHHHGEAGFHGAPRGVFVDHAFLHPDHLRALANRRFHDLRHEFRAAENIHDIDGFGDGIQIRVTGFTQHLLLQRIHRNDAVAGALHVLGHAITGEEAVSGQADHGDGARVAEDLRNLVHTALESLERWMARFSFSTSSSVRSRDAPGFSGPNSSGPIRTRLSFSTSLPRCLNIRRIWLLRPSVSLISYQGLAALRTSRSPAGRVRRPIRGMPSRNCCSWSPVNRPVTFTT